MCVPLLSVPNSVCIRPMAMGINCLLLFGLPIGRGRLLISISSAVDCNYIVYKEARVRSGFTLRVYESSTFDCRFATIIDAIDWRKIESVFFFALTPSKIDANWSNHMIDANFWHSASFIAASRQSCATTHCNSKQFKCFTNILLFATHSINSYQFVPWINCTVYCTHSAHSVYNSFWLWTANKSKYVRVRVARNIL